MATDNFINVHKTETLKKRDKVKMKGCYEAKFHKDTIWICETSSFIDKCKDEVVFL